MLGTSVDIDSDSFKYTGAWLLGNDVPNRPSVTDDYGLLFTINMIVGSKDCYQIYIAGGYLSYNKEIAIRNFVQSSGWTPWRKIVLTT